MAYTNPGDVDQDMPWRCPLCYRCEGDGHKLSCPGDQDMVTRPDERTS